MDLQTELYRSVAYLGALIAIVKWAISPLARRVADIERENRINPKRTISECKSLMDRCPVQGRLTVFGDVLGEIKRDVKEVRGDIKNHMQYHITGKDNEK